MSTVHNPAAVPAPEGGYVHGLEIAAPARLLFISGQIPVRADGSVPATFAEQCRLVWAHLGTILKSAGLEYRHLVKVTTFLADRALAEENGALRREVLGSHQPSLTVVAVDTLDARWLLEIEAVAAVS